MSIKERYVLRENYEKIQYENAILKKALELACREYICYTDEMDTTILEDDFIKQAKESLK